MSQAESRKDYASREEVIGWLRARIKEVEEELRILKGLLNLIEDTSKAGINEKVEEVKMGKRRIARIYRGEGYVRMTPEFPMPMPSEVREYLYSVKEELEMSQAKAGIGEEDRVQLSIKERQEEGVIEVRFENIHSTIEMIKARAALKYSAEILYQLYKARARGED